jgi:uncharacterized protein GlcG (DUF336 family)
MRGLTLTEALAMIEGTFASAKKRKAHPLSAIVLDAGGRVKAFQKQDGCSLLRFEIAYGKAFAALAMGRSSRMVLQKAREKPLFMDSLTDLADGPMFLEAGAQLVREASGEVVGALGVTGDVNEVDDLCAIDGIRAAGFKPEDDFDDTSVRRLNIKKSAPIKDPRPDAGGGRPPALAATSAASPSCRPVALGRVGDLPKLKTVCKQHKESCPGSLHSRRITLRP